MTFAAYAPGLQGTDFNFAAGTETFDTFGKIAAGQGMSLYNLNYQQTDQPMPTPSEGGRRMLEGLDGKLGINELQKRHHDCGVWIGNSVGGDQMLQAIAQTEFKPKHVILWGPVLGVQKKALQVAIKMGAVSKFNDMIDGKCQLDIPTSGGDGFVPVDAAFFTDPKAAWGAGFSEAEADVYKAMGFSDKVIKLFRDGYNKTSALQHNFRNISVTILTGEKDDYCMEADYTSFKRLVAPQAEVIVMPGNHAWQQGREDFFRSAIVPFTPKRPAAAPATKPAENNA